MAYIGWELSNEDRAKLLLFFEPTYPDVIAHHVTYKTGVRRESQDPLPTQTAGEVVGIADDGEGVQALVVSIDGTTTRIDGQTYHITWSIDRAAGRKPVDSNAVIATGWRRLPAHIPIHLQPKLFV